MWTYLNSLYLGESPYYFIISSTLPGHIIIGPFLFCFVSGPRDLSLILTRPLQSIAACVTRGIGIVQLSRQNNPVISLFYAGPISPNSLTLSFLFTLTRHEHIPVNTRRGSDI